MERDFKGIWIPKEIWLDKNLTLHEKLFIVEIDSLDNKNGCFAGNKYFSEFFGITRGRCTQIIKSLEQKGFVTIEHERKGLEISKRTIKVVNKLNRSFNKLNNPLSKTKHPYLENDEDNNTNTNNTNNNSKGVSKKRSKPISKELLDEQIKKRKESFKKELEVFLPIYGKETLNEFYKYWTEPNKSGTKFKKEMQDTWDTKRRIERWVKNDFGNKKDTPAALKMDKSKLI